MGKDDLKLAQRQIEQSIVNPIPRNLEELKEHDKQIRDEVIDEFANKMEKLVIKWFDSGVINLADINKIAEQLKEKK